MEGLSLEQIATARKRCPPCFELLERINEDLRELDLELERNTKTNYSRLIRIAGIGLGLGVNGYFISSYLSERYIPQIIDYFYSNFNN